MNDFIPNWKRLGMKSLDEALSYILAFLKKNEKGIANRGFGKTRVLNGRMNTLLELKGDPALEKKRKKQTIQI